MKLVHQCLVVLLTAALTFTPALVRAADSAPPQEQPVASSLTQEQLEQLVAPVALYPDDLLAQVMMASTYPLEVVDAARWVKANPGLKGEKLDAALREQKWDPSIKSLARFPQVLQMMNEKLDWTEKLGDAFLAQPQDLMDAAQRLRARAQAKGTLASNKKQTVTTKKVPGASSQVIVIQPTQPDVVYVPSYNPTVVYGPWPYPAYPPYAWYPPGYVATSVLSFGLGVAVGSSLWGYPNWGHGDVDIDVNYYTHFNGGHPPPPPPPHGGGPRPPGGYTWQHDPGHRGNVPYNNPRVAQHFQRPGSGGVSPAQQRINARDAFRGRTGMSGGGIPGQQAGRLDRGHGASGLDRRVPGGREGGMRPSAGEGRPQPRHNFQGHSSERSSVFQGAGREGLSGDFQRGARSREIMRSNPGGGGFHDVGVHGGGGFRNGGFHGGGGGFRGGPFRR